jgi:SAM-dependent methyltransferase
MTIKPEEILKTPPPDYFDWDDSDNTCFLCGEPRYEILYEITHFDYPLKFQKCQCGMIKQTPMPNQKFFDWFFNSEIFFSSKKKDKEHIWGYYDFFADEECRMFTSKRRYNKLRHIFEKNKPLNIVKIGPSTGTFLHIANQNNHNAIGCDVSMRFAQYAKEHYGVHIDHGRFEKQGYNNEQFDVVLFLSVLENIPNLQEFFEAIQRTVKIGGYTIFNYIEMRNNLIASFQKERYFIYRPPVCYAFDKGIVLRILDKFGFKIKEEYLDIRYMHMEKVLTLLGWYYPYQTLKMLKLHRTPFPIYAYPSKIICAERIR